MREKVRESFSKIKIASDFFLLRFVSGLAAAADDDDLIFVLFGAFCRFLRSSARSQTRL